MRMSAIGVFDSLTRHVAMSIGYYELQELDNCLSELEAVEKEVRELKYQVFHTKYPSGLPMNK